MDSDEMAMHFKKRTTSKLIFRAGKIIRSHIWLYVHKHLQSFESSRYGLQSFESSRYGKKHLAD